MDSSLLFGGSVIAAAIAGGVALFAPCCISVMLPAYFASAFQNRRVLVGMTFLFAAGVATVILPIALGAAALQQFFSAEHSLVFGVGGALMLALAAYVLLGGRFHLPMPGRAAGAPTGPLGVYGLGIFSGVASSCCAPVLAGVLALSGVASSFGYALGLGSAYVFGMVAPLFLLSVLWGRLGDRARGRVLRPRTVHYRIGPLERSLSGSALASGLLLALMGAATLVIGLTTDGMPAAGGWQAEISAELQHYGSVLTDALSGVPGWAAALALVGIVGVLARRAFGEQLRQPETTTSAAGERVTDTDTADLDRSASPAR